ncbi:hypothetical protein [Halalkalicoccus salilacus]|uniref:hypothetical protein n=1 Tax=Halalkalicoccus sp. GCM10025704 TaxID=3252662 RepID=UPI003615DA66
MSPASTTRDRVALAAVVFVVLLAQVVLYPGIAGLVAALGASTDLDASMWFLVAEFSAFVVCASLWGSRATARGGGCRSSPLERSVGRPATSCSRSSPAPSTCASPTSSRSASPRAR